MKKAFEIEYKYKKVEIHIVDFVGNVRNINGTPDLFSLSYNSNIKDKGQYILATEAEINIYEDAYFNIDELKTVGETDILIKYFEYDELVWQGFVLPDFFQTGITNPRVLRMIATDRIGVLKDIVNTSVGTTPKDIIEECLLQTGLTLPVEIRNKNSYIETTTIERERIEGISAYDIIRAFMVQFNSKIVQYKNKWWIVNKKLLEDGFLDQEVIDIDLVYLDGQREIKPTASDVSLYLEFGGSKRYPDNALFREWDGNKFAGWESKGGQIQRLNYKSIIDYTQVGYGTFNANFGEEGTTPSLYCRYKMLSLNFENEGNYFNNQNGVLSNTFPVKYRDGDTEVTLRVDFTTVSANVYLPFVLIMKTPDGKFYAINRNGVVVNAYKEIEGTFEIDLTKVDPIRVFPVESNYLDAVQSLFEATFTINQNALGVTSESAQLQFMVYSVGYRVPDLGSSSAYLDVLFNSIQVIFNKSEDTHKGLIFKTKQGGDKFSKTRESETVIFSGKINQGVNGYFYNYKYDDTSITNLPKEYLLEMTRQMADMFCSARDFYSIGGKFKVNPLARYKCGNKYFVLVGGVSHRENSKIDIEEIVSNDTLIRTDYIYTYFEDLKDNIKSIGTASGSGGGGSGGSGSSGGSSHEHYNKGVLDQITEAMLVGALRDLITSTDDASELTDENMLSSLRVLLEISKANEDLLEEILDEISRKYLRKDIEDTAFEKITFLKGIIASDLSTFTDLIASGKIIAEDIDVKNHLLTNTLKVILQSDLQTILLRGQMNSEMFTSGMLGHGMRLRKDGEDWELELDKITVRKSMTVYELIVQEIRYQAGQHIYGPAGAKLTKVTDNGSYWRCEHDGTMDFITGAQVLCQRFEVGTKAENPDGLQTYKDTRIKRYWRLVTGYGKGWFNLSKIDCESGSDVPEIEDQVAVLGHRTNPEWQNVIMLVSTGSDAPYIAYYAGINSYSTVGKEVIREGNLNGIVDAQFGQLKGFGSYAENVYLKGQFRLNNNKLIEDAINEANRQEYIGALNLLREYDARFDFKYWGEDGEKVEIDFNTIDPHKVLILSDRDYIIVTEDNLAIKIIL